MSINESISLGSLVVKNRLVFPPMISEKCSNGFISDDLIKNYDYLTSDANIGMVISEQIYVNSQGKETAGQAGLDSDDKIEGYVKFVDMLHKNGCIALAQLNHAGSKCKPIITHQTVVGPSAIMNPYTTQGCVSPMVLSDQQIDEIINDFAAAALRAKKAGFDGVEIHSAHGFLLNQFYSPITNKRNDLYGGSVKNRLRIHLLIIKRIRELCGDDFVISVCLGALDYCYGGNGEKDALQAAKLLAHGGIDLLNISGGLQGPYYSDDLRYGYFKDISSLIKENVDIPVMTNGGIVTKDEADDLLNNDMCDLVGVGRAIMKDNHWLNHQI